MRLFDKRVDVTNYDTPSQSPLDRHTEFWGLVEDNLISAFRLAQIVNAPIKVLLNWFDEKSVPVEALESLKKHLGLL